MPLSLKTGLLAGCAALLLAHAAQATPINYIFTGTGTGSLGGTAFSGGFTVTEVANTTGVAPFGSEFQNISTSASFVSGALSATLTGTDNKTILNPAAPGIIIFGQDQSASPFFVAEGVINSTFETYNLANTLGLTSGSLSLTIPSTFLTSSGNLTFTGITALSFQATTPSSVPEPASLAILGSALAGLGLIRRRRKHA